MIKYDLRVNDKEWLLSKINDGLNMRQISEEVSCSMDKLRDNLKNFGIYEYFYQQKDKRREYYFSNKSTTYCEICGKSSEEDVIVKYHNEIYLCTRHRSQMDSHGRILDRTYKDLNEIIEYDDYAEIILYDKNSKEKGRTIIDLSDINKVKTYKWCLMNTGYASTKINEKTILLHRFITNANENTDVDHISHNKLDNRKINLRVGTHQENMMNMNIPKHNTSGIKGVWYRKDRDMWVAEIKCNSKKYHLGEYSDFKQAAKARLLGEIKYYGDDYVDKELYEKYKEITLPNKNVKGVTWKKDKNVWMVKVFNTYIGLYKSYEEAVRKRLIDEQKQMPIQFWQTEFYKEYNIPYIGKGESNE